MNRYQCCNGLCPCSGRCGEQKCPSFCLGVEVALCFTLSVQTTRYMIQDELRIHTTKCDNCIIITMIVLEYLACIFHIIACITGSDEIRMAANILQIISDVVWCTVCACMQTQHKIELDERDKNPGSIQMQAPPQQHIQMGGGPPPGYGGYPPPQQQGYPPHGYPPPQHQGYPPPQHQGYPPPQHQGYPPQHQGYPPQVRSSMGVYLCRACGHALLPACTCTRAAVLAVR